MTLFAADPEVKATFRKPVITEPDCSCVPMFHGAVVVAWVIAAVVPKYNPKVTVPAAEAATTLATDTLLITAFLPLPEGLNRHSIGVPAAAPA